MKPITMIAAAICLTACGPATPPEPDGCAPAGTYAFTTLPMLKTCTSGEGTHPTVTLHDAVIAKTGDVCGRKSNKVPNIIEGICTTDATIEMRATDTGLKDIKLSVDQTCPDYTCKFEYLVTATAK